MWGFCGNICNCVRQLLVKHFCCYTSHKNRLLCNQACWESHTFLYNIIRSNVCSHRFIRVYHMSKVLAKLSTNRWKINVSHIGNSFIGLRTNAIRMLDCFNFPDIGHGFSSPPVVVIYLESLKKIDKYKYKNTSKIVCVGLAKSASICQKDFNSYLSIISRVGIRLLIWALDRWIVLFGTIRKFALTELGWKWTRKPTVPTITSPFTSPSGN